MNGGAFYNCSNLSGEIKIEEGTSLEKFAFEGTGITKVTIGNGVDLIDNSFSNCSKLKNVVIGDDVTIRHSTFINCGTIESVIMGKNIKMNGSDKDANATFYNSNVKKATVESLSAVGSLALKMLGKSLQGDIIINEGVTTIGNQAFSWCSNITSVRIPSTVTSIGASAFYECTNLKTAALPSGIKTIAWRSIL